jgi:hypothetical protein
MIDQWHIVYLSYEEGKYGRDYIGYHSTNNLFDGYFGSFKDDTFNPSHRIILGYYKTRAAAALAECHWHKVFSVREDLQFANQCQSIPGFFIPDHTGEKNPMFGKKRPEHAQLMRERMTGDKNPMFGKEMTEDAKLKRQKTWEEKYEGHPRKGAEGVWAGKKRPDHAEKLRGKKRPDHAERMRQYHAERKLQNQSQPKY